MKKKSWLHNGSYTLYLSIVGSTYTNTDVCTVPTKYDCRSVSKRPICLNRLINLWIATHIFNRLDYTFPPSRFGPHGPPCRPRSCTACYWCLASIKRSNPSCLAWQYTFLFRKGWLLTNEHNTCVLYTLCIYQCAYTTKAGSDSVNDCTNYYVFLVKKKVTELCVLYRQRTITYSFSNIAIYNFSTLFHLLLFSVPHGNSETFVEENICTVKWVSVLIQHGIKRVGLSLGVIFTSVELCLLC